MTAGLPRRGPNVRLRPMLPRDAVPFLEAVARSRALHHPWSHPPRTRAALDDYLARHREPQHELLLVCRNEDGALAGKYSLTQIFRGNFQNAYLGYYAFEPFAAQGYMREAMHLVLRHAFADMRLHRLQANVQPGNERSLGLLRATGWREEGYAERYLKIGGRWRDHVMFATTADGIAPGGPRRRA